jgi:hypothetical protein
MLEQQTVVVALLTTEMKCKFPGFYQFCQLFDACRAPEV